MFPFLAHILDKPMCAIREGCQNIYNKLTLAAPSLFGRSESEYSVQPRHRIKNVKSQSHKNPQRGIMREPVTLPNQKPLFRYLTDGIDRVYRRYGRVSPLKENGPYGNVERPLTEPSRLPAMYNLSNSLVAIRMLRPGNEPPRAQEKYPDLYEEFMEIDRPRNHYKLHNLGMGLYFPETNEEVDGFVLVSSDDNDEDDVYA